MNKVEMRKDIIKLYPYDKWRQKVKNMSDEQVLAIYLKNQDKIKAMSKSYAKQVIPVHECLGRIFANSDKEAEQIHIDALDDYNYYNQE